MKKSTVRSSDIQRGRLNVRRVLLAAILAALTSSAVAADSDIDTALARLGPLEQKNDFAGIEQLLRPFEDSKNGQVEYYLAFARMNLAIDRKRPDEIRPGELQPAIDMARRAALHGSKEAWNLLYMIYGNGWGVPVQGKEAIAYLKRGIDAGDAGAKLNYAIQLYMGSQFVERDVDAACPLFDQLTNTGEGLPLVAYYEGLIRFLGQCGKTADRKAGMDLIRISADRGVRDAERDMGKNYEFGWTVTPDDAQAIAWYEKAADHGDPEAQWRLGMAYVLGRLGEAQDYGKARSYFESAAASGYSRAMTDLDIAEDLGARPDQHATADLGMAILMLLAGAAERDAMQDRDVILDHGRLAADEAGGMVEEDAAADTRGRIDVGLEHRGRTALQIGGEVLAALLEQPVRETMGLQRMKALEVEQGIDEAGGGGIAVIDGDEVGAEGVADVGIVAQRLVIGLADQVAGQCGMIEPVGQAMHHRMFEPVVMQHCRENEGGEFRLAADDVLGFATNALPNRIERAQLADLRIDVVHGHGRFSLVG